MLTRWLEVVPRADSGLTATGLKSAAPASNCLTSYFPASYFLANYVLAAYCLATYCLASKRFLDCLNFPPRMFTRKWLHFCLDFK